MFFLFYTVKLQIESASGQELGLSLSKGSVWFGTNALLVPSTHPSVHYLVTLENNNPFYLLQSSQKVCRRFVVVPLNKYCF